MMKTVSAIEFLKKKNEMRQSGSKAACDGMLEKITTCVRRVGADLFEKKPLGRRLSAARATVASGGGDDAVR